MWCVCVHASMHVCPCVLMCVCVCACIIFQELTEEGLPFLILFYDPDEPHTKKVFKQRVMDVLDEVKGLF